jgi:uncharacterized protein (DUF488 family)
MAADDSACFPIYSIGHSNHPFERFLALLKQYGIGAVVDVRSVPVSGYCPHFSSPVFERLLEGKGIRYCFAGKELGGRPKDPAFYDDAGHARYDLMAEAAYFKRGISELKNWTHSCRAAMICSEEDPLSCHRFLLITRELESQGLGVLHIRGDGGVQTSEEAFKAAQRKDRDADQMMLFDTAEPLSWSSIQSVSPKKVLQSSSDH